MEKPDIAVNFSNDTIYTPKSKRLRAFIAAPGLIVRLLTAYLQSVIIDEGRLCGQIRDRQCSPHSEDRRSSSDIQYTHLPHSHAHGRHVSSAASLGLSESADYSAEF